MNTPYLRINTNGLRAKSAKDLLYHIEQKIDRGEIPSGLKIPPVRVLAHQFGVSKNTIHKIYQELSDRGKILSKNRVGYLVLGKNSESKIKKSIHEAEFEFRSGLGKRLLKGAFPHQILEVEKMLPLTLKALNFEKDKSLKRRLDRAPIVLSSTFIGKELLPLEKLNRCFRSVLRQPGIQFMYDRQGYRPLREVIAKRLQNRGMDAHADWVVTTCGSQQGLDLCTKIQKIKKIATENPAYFYGKNLFQMNGMESIGLPVDPFGGISQNIWQEALKKFRPSAFYLITNFQNPTGYSYSSSELDFILNFSSDLGVGLIEDDWGSDMLPYSEFRTPLRALGGNQVLYLNSFTKKLLPSLRLGYVLGNSENISALIAAKAVSSLGNSSFLEAALFEFIDRGYYDQHLKHLQCELDNRYQACLKMLGQTMPNGVRWTKPGGGPSLWLELPKELDVAVLANKLRKKNVIIVDKMDEWFYGKPHLNGFRIGFALNEASILERGLGILGEVISREIK